MSHDPFLRLDTATRSLLRDSERVKLSPKAFAILLVLLDNAGKIVRSNELLRQVWSDADVDHRVLKVYILELRRALQDDAHQCRFIETVSRRGYKWRGPIPALTKSNPTRRQLFAREPELAELIAAFHSAILSRRQTVLIRGEPGIGKTALLEHFTEWCQSRSKVWLVRADCVESIGLDAPWQPVIELVAELLRLPAGESAVRVLRESAPTVVTQFPHLLAASGHRDISRQASNAANGGSIIFELCEFIERLAATNPLVLLLEDLHWADTASLDLISALVRRSGPARLLVVLTARPAGWGSASGSFSEFEEDLRFRRLCTTIKLDELAVGAARSCLEEWLSGPIEQDEAAVLHSLAGGNPLVLRALADHLRAIEGLVLDGATWRLTAERERILQRIPDDLLEFLSGELARLTEYELKLLRAGSIAGVTFSSGAVSTMLGEPVEDVESACGLLARSHRIIQPAAMTEAVSAPIAELYSFRHALYREALLRNTG